MEHLDHLHDVYYLETILAQRQSSRKQIERELGEAGGRTRPALLAWLDETSQECNSLEYAIRVLNRMNHFTAGHRPYMIDAAPESRPSE